MRTVTVLVVDDYEPFRRFIRTELADPKFRIVEEASDGFQAVRDAEELQPDLILLDLGLPQLNGMEAAARITKVAPRSKILFLSQEGSSDVVQAALSVGALGYVHKSRAHGDLLLAIESVLSGRQFVSASLEMLQAPNGANAPSPNRHGVEFYSKDATLVESVTGFIAPALRNHDAAIVIATDSHRAGFVQKLKEQGLDVDDAVRRGTYVSLDASELLSRIMVNGLPDGVRFFNGLSDLTTSVLEAADTKQPRVAIFGEGVSLLCAEGNTDAAIRLEKLANVFGRAHENVEILCAYPLSALYSGMRKHVYDCICKEHSAVRVQ